MHAFATRPLDVACRVDERQSERARRRRQMAVDLGFEADRLTWCHQVHRTEFARVATDHVGGPREAVDAILTNLVGTPLMTFSADCPLVLVFDPRRRALGLAHASWRCTTALIVTQLVGRLTDRYGSSPGDLWAGIGPSAGPCCYEVRDDVRDAAREIPGVSRPIADIDEKSVFPRRDGRMFFDLWKANAAQLAACGVPAGQIELAGVCTLCRNDLFYSFRREGTGCGHFGLMAGLAAPR